MTSLFVRRLVDFVTETGAVPAGELPYVRPVLEDTLAVIHAGWGEPVTRRTASLYPAAEGQAALDVPHALAPQDAALVLGAAGHALDFDDAHMVSTAHPSAPLVAALLALLPHAEAPARLAAALGVGLSVNTALGRVLGFFHYEKGWHATSTIGPLAAAAACAHLLGLGREPTAWALSLAASQAGGLQRNFGTMAKPLHVGMAAAAGVRSALLARAGVTGDADPFGPKGVFDLYGGERLATPPEEVTFDLHPEGVSVKLYPCCYNAHRPIAAALEARERLAGLGVAPEAVAAVEVVGPPGAFMALRIKEPRIGSEGKFCGPHAVACALADGTVTLAHFEDDAVLRPDLRALRARIVVREAPQPGSTEGRRGPVTLEARGTDGATLVTVERKAFPGSPEDPPTPEQRAAKVRDCLAYYARHAGGTGALTDYEAFQAALTALLEPAGTVRAAGD